MNLSQKKAVILIVHGSRRQESAIELETLVQQVNDQNPLPCFPAYMELQSPSLLEQIDSLNEQGFREIEILPLFILAGKHIAHDIPELLAECLEKHPNLKIELLPQLSQHQAFQDAIVQITC